MIRFETDIWRALYFRLCRLTLGGMFALGVMLAVFLPPFQTPDEPAHWEVAFARVERLLAKMGVKSSGCAPAYALSWHFDVGRIAFSEGERMAGGRFAALNQVKRHCTDPRLNYGSLLTYYGVALARLVVPFENRSARAGLVVFYLGRLLQGILLLALLMRLLRLAEGRAGISAGMLTLMVFCCGPLFLQQSFSISADTIILAAAVALAWMCLFWNDLTPADFVVAALLSVVAVHTKPVFFPLVACAVGLGHFASRRLSPDGGFSRRQRLRWGLALTAVSLVGAVWVSLGDHSPAPNQYMGRHINIGEQLAYVRENFWKTLALLNSNFWAFFSLRKFEGPLGWLTLAPERRTVSAWHGLLWAAVAFDALAAVQGWRLRFRAGNMRFSGRSIAARLAGCTVFAAGLYVSALLYPLVLYLCWTEVGAGSVSGVQARYFLSIALLLIVCVSALVRPSPGAEGGCFGAAAASGNRASGRLEAVLAGAGWAVCLAWLLVFGAFWARLCLDLGQRYW